MRQRVDDRFTYPRELLLTACKGRAPAEILNYLLGCFHIRYKKYQNDPLESEHFTFQYSASYIASKTFYCERTIKRGLKELESLGLIFIRRAKDSLNRTNSIAINFVKLEMWKSSVGMPLLHIMEGTGRHHAECQDVTMESDTVSPSIVSPCPHVYKHLIKHANTHSSSITAAADDELKKEKSRQLQVEAGFSEPLATSLVTQHGVQLVDFALSLLRGRKLPPNEAVGFVRGVFKNPANYNAMQTESGWMIPIAPGKRSVWKDSTMARFECQRDYRAMCADGGMSEEAMREALEQKYGWEIVDLAMKMLDTVTTNK